MNGYRFIGFIVLLTCLISCKSAQDSVSVQENPDLLMAVAQLHDFSKLDGCTIMLVTRDGLKLLPQNRLQIADLAIGQFVKIQYEKLVDNASTCMAEDSVIKIVSIEKLPLKDHLPDCEPINAPAEKQWLLSAIRRNGLQEVQRHQFGEHYLYWGIERTGTTTIYDCIGTPLCILEEDKQPKCQDWLDDMTFEFTIYDRSFRK